MRLADLLKSKTRIRILKFFFLNKNQEYYLRELERSLSLSVGNIRRELITLEKLGLFNREKKGNSVYYSLNEKSPLLNFVEEAMFKKKKGDKADKAPKKPKKNELTIIKEKDLDILFSKIGELENILEMILQKKSVIEDFINLGIVKNKKGEILLIKRTKKEKGWNGAVLNWAFPGGQQRLNESRSDCVAREVLAETGYRIKVVREISFRRHPQFPVYITYHLCKLIKSKPIARIKESHEIAEIKWVKPKQIEKLFTTNFDSNVRHELGLE